MKKIFIVVACLLMMVTTTFGQATNWNINARPTSDWFSANDSFRNIPLQWMRDIDPLIAASSNPGTGSSFYVDSGVSNEGDGTDWLNAKDTLDEAINLCTAGQGDTIYIAQGHTETLGTGADVVDIDVDDITIIQVGSNTISNGFDYTDYDTGTFAISGDDVTLVNLRFHTNLPDVNEAVELEANATRVSFIGCLFDSETPGTDEFFRCIKQDGANANQLTVRNCEFRMGAGAAECAIDLIDSDYAKIVGNLFEGDYAIADVNNATTASIHILIADNVMINGTVGGTAGLNAQPCIELKTDTSGVILNNYLICNEGTPDAAIVGADMWVLNNWYQETEGGVSAAPMWLTTDTADNIIGFDDNDNAAATTNVAANADGSVLERLEQIDTDTSAIATDTAAMDTSGELVALIDPNYVTYDSPRVLICAAADLSSGWDTGDSPVTVGTVTGDVLVQVVAVVQTNCTSTSNNGTLELGTTDVTNSLLVQDAVDGTAFQQGDVWTTSGTADNDFAALQDEWACIGYGQDIIATVATNSMTAGAITYYIFWIPLSADAALTSAL